MALSANPSLQEMSKHDFPLTRTLQSSLRLAPKSVILPPPSMENRVGRAAVMIGAGAETIRGCAGGSSAAGSAGWSSSSATGLS